MAHNNDITLQLLNAVFYLAASQGKELCFDSEDGNIYEVKARTEKDVTLLPIGGGEGNQNDTPIFNLNPSRLVFRGGLSARFGNIGIETAFNGIETEPKQPYIQTANGNGTDAERTTNSTKTEILMPTTANTQNFIGFGKVDLQRFSILYSGETARLAAKVENLLDKIFASTNKQPTILKTIDDYNAAKKYAKNGQLYELKLLADRLQGRINKQGAMQTAKDTMTAQSTAKRKMMFSAVAAVVIVVLWLFIGRTTNEHREVPPTQTETVFAELSPLDQAIMEWESATGKKIYPSGRECLAKATVGMSKDQIIKVINQNVK